MATIFHIASAAAWQEAAHRARYEADSLSSEGFIHCSEPHQVIRVANARFRNRRDLVMLQIDTTQVEAPIRFENLEGGDEPFPHVYGSLPMVAIVAAWPLTPNGDGSFDDSHLRAPRTSG